MVWWWNRMIYNDICNSSIVGELWFDDEIEWYTTDTSNQHCHNTLWFDDEIEWYTTLPDRRTVCFTLWFDDEIEWYTTSQHYGHDARSCGLMMK